MLRAAFIFLLVLIFCVASKDVDAHPGGLDAKGGHKNRKTGVYHLHQKSSKPKKKTLPKKIPSKKKPTTTKSNSSKQPAPFAEFDAIREEEAAKAAKNKPAVKVKLIPYQLIKTERSHGKSVIYVQLKLKTKELPSLEELLLLSKKLDSGKKYLIYFFLPKMKLDASPWAVASKEPKKGLKVIRFNKRIPRALRTMKPKAGLTQKTK